MTESPCLRTYVREKLDILINNDEISKNIEIGIFNVSIKQAENIGVIKKWDNIHFKKLYLLKFISMYSNIDPNSYIKNIDLLDKIKSGELNAYNVPFMTPQELFPERWKEIMDKKQKRDEIKFEKRKEIATNLYRCGGCGKRECSMYQLQTRSSDEAMTTFVTCLNCDKKWKC